MHVIRRDFLKCLLGVVVVAAGTLATTPVLAIEPSPDLEPIAETIRQYQELVRIYEAARSPMLGEYSTELAGTITAKFNTLLGYMMEQFGGCDCTKEDLAVFWNEQMPDVLTAKHMESIARGSIPVCVAKNVLGKQKMYVTSEGMTNWNPFVQRYYDLLPLKK